MGALGLSPEAAEGEELGTLLQQRLTLERQFSDAINQTLAHLIDPKRAFATVSVDLDARLLRETVTQRGAHAMSFTVGTVSSEKYVKLPGLPRMRPGKISEPVRIRIDPKKKRLTRTSQVAVVRRLHVRLYADTKIPPKRLDALKEAIHAVAGLQKKRGDTITVVPFSFHPPPKTQIVVPAEKPSYWLSIAAVPLALVVAALILALGLMRRRSATRGGGNDAHDAHVTEHISIHGGSDEGAKNREDTRTEDDEASVATTPRRRFLPTLTGLTRAELVELLATLPPKDAELVLALAPLSARELGAIIDTLTPREGFSKIAARVALERTVAVEKISALDERLGELIERLRNPQTIHVGSPERLGALLRVTSRHTTRDILTALDAAKPKLSAAVRSHLFQFEDLPEISVELRRRLVAAVDTEDLAKALIGADDTIRKAIHEVLSRRLERILREEERALGSTVPEAEIERARETLQRAFHTLEEPSHA